MINEIKNIEIEMKKILNTELSQVKIHKRDLT